jgi:glycosyltransferase involved in cell wall biosynthesis
VSAEKSQPRPRVVAVLTARNEERFIAGAIEHLVAQGVAVYVCDHGSDDGSAELAGRYLGAGVVGIEHIPFTGRFQWRDLLRRKEELFQSLDADWVMHADADEVHLPPPGHATLAEAIAAADSEGYDAVEFEEFTFIPTREEPDHDHPDFARTLRTYYPFRPRERHLVRAFKAGGRAVEIAWSGGHHPRSSEPFRIAPTPFRMRHYLFLSAEHAARKYGSRRYDPDELADGWHGWRARVEPGQIRLPYARQLRRAETDNDLDPSEPWTAHWLDGEGRGE